MEYAQQLRQALVNVPDGAQLFTVKGMLAICLPTVTNSDLDLTVASHGYLALLSSSIVNQVLNKFLTRQAPARSDFEPREIPHARRMKMALDQLAEFKDDPSISERDPLSPLSFCCVTD